MSGILLLIMCLFVDSNWLGALFLVEASTQLLRAYSIDQTLTDKMYLLNPNAYVIVSLTNFSSPSAYKAILIYHADQRPQKHCFYCSGSPWSFGGASLEL